MIVCVWWKTGSSKWTKYFRFYFVSKQMTANMTFICLQCKQNTIKKKIFKIFKSQ